MKKRTLLLNIISNWGGQILVALVGFLVTPLTISTVGLAHYGLLTLAVSVCSQLILFDLGISTSLTRQVPYYRQQGDERGLRELLASGGLLLLCGAAASLAAIAALTGLLPRFFHVPQEESAIFTTLLWIFAADNAIEIVAGLFLGIHGGLERFVFLNKLNVGRSIVNAAASVVVLLAGGGVVQLAATMLVTRLGYRILLGISAARRAPIVPSAVSKEGIRSVLGFGVWVGVVLFANRIISQIDTIVVGGVLGATAAARYAPPLMVTEQLRLLGQLGWSPLIPRMSSLWAAGRTEEIQELMLKWARKIQLLLGSVTVPVLLDGDSFLRLWLGPEFDESAPIISILTLTAMLGAPSGAFACFLYASAKHRLYGKLLALEAGLNLALSLVLVRLYGSVGVALGTLLSSVVVSGTILPARASRELGIHLRRFYVAGYLNPLPALLAYAAVVIAIKSLIGFDSWTKFLALHLAAALGYLWTLKREFRSEAAESFP